MIHALLPTLRRALEEGGVEAAREAIRGLGEPLEPRLDEALRLSAAALAEAPESLPAQLLGRLDGRSEPERALRRACQAEAVGLVPLSPSLTAPFPIEPKVLGQHQRDVNALCVLPDGDRVISSSEDGTLRVWSLSKGGEIDRLKGHRGPVNRVDLAPDGEAFVTAGDDGDVRIWDAETLACLHVLPGHKAYVRDAAILGDVVLTASEDKGVRLWDRDSGALLHTFTEHGEHPSAVAIHPRGHLGVSSSIDNDLLRWDLIARQPDGAVYKTESFVASMGRLYIAAGPPPEHGHTDGAKAMVFTDDGDLLSASNELIRWNPDLATTAWVAKHPWPIADLAVAPDRRVVVTASSNLRAFDLDTGEPLGQLAGPERNVKSLAFTPDGRQLVAGGDKGELWVLPFDPERLSSSAHSDYVYALTLSPDGARAASMDSNDTPALWDTYTGERVASLLEHPESGSRPFAWTPDGRLVTCRQSTKAEGAPNLFLRDADGAVLRTYRVDQPEGRPLSPHAIAPISDDLVLLGNLGEGLLQLELSSGHVSLLSGHTNQISEIRARGSRAVTLGYFEPPKQEGEERPRFGNSVSQLQGWDLDTMTLTWTVAAVKPKDLPWGGGFSELTLVGDRVLYGVGRPDYRVVARSLETGEELDVWRFTGWVSELFTDGERALALVGEGEQAPYTLRLFELLPGGACELRMTFPKGLGRITVDLTAGLIVGGLEQTLIVMDLHGEELGRMRLDTGVRPIALRPDGGALVVGDQKGGVHVLELR
ncbi:MAG: hypothetical protein H6741_27515 [Alphaproteobacteria bacterium]|nr:hypothetical protein [Alphaproteobacteria bacterium]